MLGKSPEKIRAVFIIEVLGRPVEHVKEATENFIEQIDKEQGVKVVKKTVHEPKEIEENAENRGRLKNQDLSQKLFVTFAEVEAEFESMNNVLFIAFKYMPSNFEIISPESLTLKNNYFNELISGVLLRLHKYDEIVKTLMAERQIIEQNLRKLLAEKGLLPEKKSESNDAEKNNVKKPEDTSIGKKFKNKKGKMDK